MNNAEKELKEELLKLGFSYDKMLPRMYESDKSFVLMDGEELDRNANRTYDIVFTLIVIKPKPDSLCLIMLKANLKKLTSEGVTDITKREYWAHKEKLPSKYQIYKELANSLPTLEIENKISIAKNNKMGNKKRI